MHLSETSRNAVRAALATAVAVVIAYALHHRYGYWIPMTTIILIQSSFGASIKKSKQRIIGTILGVLVGVMLVTLFQQQPYFIDIAIPLLILLSIYFLAFSYVVAIFVMTTLIVILITFGHANPWGFAFERILDTLIGAALAILGAIIIFPKWARQDFAAILVSGIEECHKCFMMLNLAKNPSKPPLVRGGLRCSSPPDKGELEGVVNLFKVEQLLTESRQRLDDYSHEPSSMVIADGSAYAIIIAEERMHSILLSLAVIGNIEIQNHIEDFIKEIDHSVMALINAIRKRKELPDFSKATEMLCDLRQVVNKDRHRDTNGLVLFYHNLYSYVSELKHIAQAIRQLRGNIKR